MMGLVGRNPERERERAVGARRKEREAENVEDLRLVGGAFRLASWCLCSPSKETVLEERRALLECWIAAIWPFVRRRRQSAQFAPVIFLEMKNAAALGSKNPVGSNESSRISDGRKTRTLNGKNKIEVQ